MVDTNICGVFRPDADTVARNLMGMTVGCTVGEITSLQELVKLLLEQDLISPRVVK